MYPSDSGVNAQNAWGGDNEHTIDGQGWTLLAQGRLSAVLQVFDRQAVNNPDKDGPEVGYALAAASTGDLIRDKWARGARSGLIH